MADLGKVVVTDGGNYSASVTYEKLTFVHYQGDAYMTLKTVKGVTPTDDGTNYKLFCKSAELATATKAGIVLPDGTTTTVDGNGKISVKKATTSAAGIVKPAATDFIMAADGTQKINTQFTQATELANIIAGEAIAQVWGKVSKAIATTMNLDQNALLKNMISNIAVNDPDKLNSAAYIYTLVERIGMGTELAVGANLTDGLNKVNSDLAFDFGANAAGLTSASVECRQLGKICLVSGIIVPNQAGTPLTLAGLAVRPKYKVAFQITGYAKVASFGLLDLDGMLLCNIPTAMMNEQCIINFAYIAAD